MAITIKKLGITKFDVDCVVNAANEGLWAGGGVCGAIFREAGAMKLTAACRKIGHCDTGNAVITPAFKLKAKYIIHAVGPVYKGGNKGERELLYGAYANSLRVMLENGCHSIAFPLISAGIFGYPKEEAWQVALEASKKFLDEHPNENIDIFFGVLDDDILELGEKIYKEIQDMDILIEK